MREKKGVPTCQCTNQPFDTTDVDVRMNNSYKTIYAMASILRCEYCCLVHVKKVYCVVQVLSHKCMVEYRLKLIFI